MHLQVADLRQVYIDAPGMGGNNLLADRQPKTRILVTPRSTALEVLEQLVQLLPRSPWPLAPDP